MAVECDDEDACDDEGACDEEYTCDDEGACDGEGALRRRALVEARSLQLELVLIRRERRVHHQRKLRVLLSRAAPCAMGDAGGQ